MIRDVLVLIFLNTCMQQRVHIDIFDLYIEVTNECVFFSVGILIQISIFST